MPDSFTKLLQRVTGQIPVVQPLLAPRFGSRLSVPNKESSSILSPKESSSILSPIESASESGFQQLDASPPTTPTRPDPPLITPESQLESDQKQALDTVLLATAPQSNLPHPKRAIVTPSPTTWELVDAEASPESSSQYHVSAVTGKNKKSATSDLLTNHYSTNTVKPAPHRVFTEENQLKLNPKATNYHTDQRQILLPEISAGKSTPSTSNKLSGNEQEQNRSQIQSIVTPSLPSLVPNLTQTHTPYQELAKQIPEQRRSSHSPAPSAVVRVTIGRIDVRAVNPPAPSMPPPSPTLSLDDYLKQRNEGQG